MTPFNLHLAITGLSIGLFFISHPAIAAEAQLQDYRVQQDLQQLQQQQQIDQLQQQQNQLQQGLDQNQLEPLGQIRRHQSNDLQQQLDQYKNEWQQNHSGSTNRNGSSS